MLVVLLHVPKVHGRGDGSHDEKGLFFEMQMSGRTNLGICLRLNTILEKIMRDSRNEAAKSPKLNVVYLAVLLAPQHPDIQS